MRLLPVTSLDDPRLAVYRDVRDADLRARDGLFLVEGRLNVKRLIGDPGHRTRSVFLSETALAAMRGSLTPLDAATPVYVASRALLCDVVGFAMHRGCLALGERPPEPELDALLTPTGPRTWIALEAVTNAENVGAIFRNALAFGAAGVVLTRGCVDPLYRRAIRVSMGATLRLPFARIDDAAAARSALAAAGFTQVALTPAADAAPLSTLAPGRLAVWLGGEGSGLSAATAAGADRRIRIPMSPGVDSLNVATAAAIALHHVHASRAAL